MMRPAWIREVRCAWSAPPIATLRAPAPPLRSSSRLLLPFPDRLPDDQRAAGRREPSFKPENDERRLWEQSRQEERKLRDKATLYRDPILEDY